MTGLAPGPGRAVAAPGRGDGPGLAPRLLSLYTWLLILYAIVPIAVMVVFSFNQAPSGRVTLKWLGFTTAWYGHAFAVADLTDALVHSLEVAFGSMIVSVILGTPLALALARYRFRGKAVTDMVIFADIAAPAVVVGASLLSFFLTLNLPRGLLTILMAHIAFNVAFVVVVVRARVSGLDRALDRAAADLGATPWVAFWKVTFPLILPGIVAAGLLAFALSIDDLIITSFVSGQTLTFPLWIYGAVKTGIPPQVFVLSTFIFLGGVVLTLINTIVVRRNLP
ncbi:spermidine/putrescine transport system permease protein [Tistlia consotensis]|uniref:Spermidine/putrescine transport system permease protein n=1 Tax=Tistlia consotensis USBA 355 TaxID=560819 RepID=A0A1Y6BDQ9_9PROT|nr:ABC transporter permease [Tistlia consotensis]SME99402.1 spermidine/putrescine transport system permease protein [Tistlia consotensis USBA 355]SNR76934.1 spermidine/putrescine transport system permease protein [Tistlia consotensis]